MIGDAQVDLKFAFVTGGDSCWRNLRIRMKYAIMKARGIFYPDVYTIPVWLGGRCDYLGNGASLNPNKYDLMFAELNSSDTQLEYLLNVVEVFGKRSVLLPGPPGIFQAYVSDAGRRMAGEVLRKCGHVWAFSQEVAAFADDLTATKVAQVIPWPFDYASTVRLGKRGGKPSHDDVFHVLIGCPLRFMGFAENSPHFLEECIRDALSDLPPQERKRFRFHAFVYTREDRIEWMRSSFGRRIGVVMERRRNYGSFLKFIGRCASVIHLSSISILGRITFFSAALGKPGIFTGNVELNRRLYLNSLVHGPADGALRDLIRELLRGLAGVGDIRRFLPNIQAAQEVGDFRKNGVTARGLLSSEALPTLYEPTACIRRM